MFGFLIMFSFVFFALTSLFYLLFHSYSKNFSTWLETMLSCFKMVSVQFSSVSDLTKTNPLIAGLCLFLFIFLAVFLLSNMFISIIVDNFNVIRQEQAKEANEVELIQFTVQKVKQWLGRKLIFI